MRPKLVLFAAALAILAGVLPACTQVRIVRPGTQAPARYAAPRPDATLQRRLETTLQGFNGQVGVYVRHLPSGREAAVNADTVFPTASMIKVPLLVALHDRFERGELHPDSQRIFEDSLRYAASDLSGKLRPGQPITVNELAYLMIGLSDNTASLWIQRMVGTGTAVNAWLVANGFDSTRVNSRTPGREAARSRFGWGQTTPREMSELLVRIRQGRAVNPRASERMYRLLTDPIWEDVALSQIPPTVQVAFKYGAVDQSRSETLLVNAPGGDYVLTVITKNQQDRSWTPTNEGWTLIRAVSRAAYEHFNPGDPWRPGPGTGPTTGREP